MLLVARDADKYRPEGAKFDRYLTWLQVSEEVDRLGVAQAGAEWRHAALTPTATARLRALHELQVLLETLDVVKGSMHALTNEAPSITPTRIWAGGVAGLTGR